MDTKQITDTVIAVAKRYNIDQKDIKKLLLKICIASFKYIDREEMWSMMFDEDFIHWDLVKKHKENILGDSSTWICLLQFFSWDHLQKIEGVMKTSCPMLVALRSHMHTVGLDIEKDRGWTLTCKVKILSMLLGVSTLTALDILMCNEFKRSTTQQCMQLITMQAETLYTQEEQADTIKFILEKVRVDTNVLEQNFAIHQAIREDTQRSLKVSRMQIVQGRPRLRDRLTHSLEKRNLTTDDTFSMWETFTGFCYKHQFPPMLSENMKLKLYFMSAQQAWDWRKHLHKVAPGLPMITAKVADYPVTQAELPVIIKIITNLSLDGDKPFAALNHFRVQCFQAFPVSHVQTMTITQFLQLYVAVYQNKAIWKDIWRHVIGVISVQIIKDVEEFVRTTPFADEHFMSVFAPNSIADKPRKLEEDAETPIDHIRIEDVQICE